MAVERHITLNDSRVVYDGYNAHLPGPALVFIHGYTCSSALWSGQVHLMQRMRSLAIDLPGHGRSGAPAAGHQYTMEFFANAVAAVLLTEETSTNTNNNSRGPAILIGHSMGGPVATMLLRLHPHLVNAIIYVDSFFDLPESLLTHAQRQALAAKRSDDTFWRATIESFFTTRTPANARDKILQIMLSTTPKHVRVNTCTTDVQPHAWRRDEVFDAVPALAIHCGMFQVDEERWKAHLPKLTVKEWSDGYGHFLFMEDPERFNEELSAWLRGVAGLVVDGKAGNGVCP
ncbi:uncharacterized protein AB675_10442 [Cyphellophora attinorum]|uniref:AB hydrolase-1 domain-containing protein n=1 Tax=Cyphellophora attinorum TaxID=1664694 RepID=A0A0N0NIM6_9EURO|nr:uncharacterized protein AB675_10442 [Phialophora attinorum]KPI35918.1 hypothetical protein AB675_10442 [Phialophora attinorum]